MVWHAVYRRSLPASYISRQQTETSILHSRRPRGQLVRHALRLPCIRCGGPKGMEPAADTRDSRPVKDGIKDLSSLHPVTVPNCLTRRALVMTYSCYVAIIVRNCRQCYYYYCLQILDSIVIGGYFFVVTPDAIPIRQHLPVNDYLVLLVTCTLTTAVIYLEIHADTLWFINSPSAHRE